MNICLPFEILTAIFEQVDDVRDLCHVRAASRTFCAAATPIAFRVLSVISTAGSAQNLGQLLDNLEIAAHVREVAFCDTGADSTDSKATRVLVRQFAIPQLASSFSCVHQLRQLESINLTFSCGRGFDDDVEGRLALQASILGALATSFSFRAPLKLTSLSLHNLYTWDLTALDSPPFQTVLKTLRHLRLSVISDGGLDPPVVTERWSHFWSTLCSRMILTPMQHSLVELTLHSNILAWGLSLAGLYFPCLCVISLHRFVFEPSVGAEPFILQHAATLARLELIACKLPVYDDNIFSSSTTHARDGEASSRLTYWERIWGSFAAELTALVTLHVDECGSDTHFSPKGRYVQRMYQRTTRTIPAPAHVDAADATALRRFYMTVAARSEKACVASRGA